jgi:hypothetical protein
LEAGHRNVRHVLDYLDDAYELYERSDASNRTKLSPVLFDRLWIDVGEDYATYVAEDQLTEPFATVVYLRREHWSVPAFGHEEGGARISDTAFSSRVLDLLKPIFTDVNAQSSVAALWRRIGDLNP